MPKPSDKLAAAVVRAALIRLKALGILLDTPESAQLSEAIQEAVRKFRVRAGKLGGRRLAENTSPAERSQSARRAANARWAKR